MKKVYISMDFETLTNAQMCVYAISKAYDVKQSYVAILKDFDEETLDTYDWGGVISAFLSEVGMKNINATGAAYSSGVTYEADPYELMKSSIQNVSMEYDFEDFDLNEVDELYQVIAPWCSTIQFVAKDSYTILWPTHWPRQED